MSLTKTKAIAAFEHVLHDVFEVPDDGHLAKALEQAGYDNKKNLVYSVITKSYHSNSKDPHLPTLTYISII